MDLEVANILREGATRIDIPKENQLLSNIFIRPKKDGEFRPIINLKRLNQFVRYQHFKMEGLRDVKNMLSDGDLMCKLDLKDAYFTVPVCTRSRKTSKISVEWETIRVSVPSFRTGTSPQDIHKITRSLDFDTGDGEHPHRSTPGGPSFTGKPLCEGKSKQLFCRKNKTVSAKLAKAHKRQKLMDLEVANILREGATRIDIPKENQLLSNIFIRPKKDGEFRPIINLKRLNQFVRYQHFKMEGLRDVKNMLSDGDLMCKLDLKDAYFTVPLCTRSRKLARFRWNGKLYEFQCLAFGLGPALRIFTKLLEVSISIQETENIRLIIYLDDLLLMWLNYQEICLERYTAISLFHQLGLMINWKKSILEPQTFLLFYFSLLLLYTN